MIVFKVKPLTKVENVKIQLLIFTQNQLKIVEMKSQTLKIENCRGCVILQSFLAAIWIGSFHLISRCRKGK